MLTPTALARTTAALRASGSILFDLTVTNPTAAGISYPPALLSSLDRPRGREYRPEPLGEPEARAAVAATYATARRPVMADDVVLTASTSEAYSLLFKLLADPGDAVLVPQPSYPLFDLLGRLEGVVARPYRLDYHGVWSIDRDSVERALTSDVRAVLLVNPNNPTGSMLRADDREWIVTLARARGVALVSDEVFADYPLRRRPDATSLVGETRALTFVLGGLSKSAGLPQVKLGWIVVGGPAPERADALARLEIICDTYLSVSTPVQVAAPDLIDTGRVIRSGDRRASRAQSAGARRGRGRVSAGVAARARGRLVRRLAGAGDCAGGEPRADAPRSRSRGRASRILLRFCRRGVSRRQSPD